MKKSLLIKDYAIYGQFFCLLRYMKFLRAVNKIGKRWRLMSFVLLLIRYKTKVNVVAIYLFQMVYFKRNSV